MASIYGVGGYVPVYRIDRSAVAEQHGGSASGASAVPSRDETVLTMASEATSNALARAELDASRLAAIFTASVTDPFAEHGIGAHVGHRHGADTGVRTGDFQGSPRAATDALLAGRHVAEATDEPVLVAAADVMPVEPGHDDEPYSGAAAAAVVLAPPGTMDRESSATIHGSGVHTSGFVERHRLHGEAAESGDQRFEGEHGFGEAVPEAIQAALGTMPEMPTAAVVAAPDQRMARAAVSEFPGEIEHVRTFDRVGYAGAATFLLDLVHLVERADAGTPAVGVNYGAGGADAIGVTVGEANREAATTVAEYLADAASLTYAKHLRNRERPEYRGVSVE